jgi:hypothetical protein
MDRTACADPQCVYKSALYLSENIQFALERPADSGVGDIVGVYYENLNRTGSALYRNTEARSPNHFCDAKAVLYSICVCVLALVIRHAQRIFSAQHYIVTYGLSGCTIILQIIS